MSNPPTYLASLKGNIRQRPIPWEGTLRAGNLTEEHFSRIDKAKKADGARKERIEADLDGYRALFVGGVGKPSVLETAGKNPKLLQYLLVLLADLLEDVPSLAKSLVDSPQPYHYLLPLLASQSSSSSAPNTEDPIPLLAATASITLMSTTRDTSPPARDALPIMLTYLAGLARSSDAGLQDIAVQEFSSLMYSQGPRQQFWSQRSETVKPLIETLGTAAGIGKGENPSANLWGSAGGSAGTTMRATGFEGNLGGGVGLQLLYHCLLVIWQLSFEAEDIGDDMNDEYDIVVLYTQLLRLSPKEKTTRLILSTLLNLLQKNQRSLLPTAVLARLPGLLQNLSGRQLTDPDLLQDLAALRELVDEYTKTKTTFDEYMAEVDSGHLRWSPPHRNEVFWAENARRIFDHDNGKIPRQISNIMKKPWDNDKQVLAVACNDIGFLVREAPERRHLLEKLGLKVRVMELMQEADESVRWESLRALGSWLKYSFDSK